MWEISVAKVAAPDGYGMLWHVMARYGSEDQGRMKNVYLKPPQLPTFVGLVAILLKVQ